MRHFRHHIGDYAAATAHLSMLEDAAYHRLLRHYYQHEKPIPSIESEIYRICRATHRSEKKAVNIVLREFFTLEQDGWHQRRADEEINTYKALANRARTNGAKHVGTNKEPSDMPESVDQPRTKNQEPITSSEAYASGAKAPSSKDVIFSECLPWLMKATGKSRDRCASIVGGWCRDFGDDAVLAAIEDAYGDERPMDWISWIAGKFKPREQHETWNERRIRLCREVIAK